MRTDDSVRLLEAKVEQMRADLERARLFLWELDNSVWIGVEDRGCGQWAVTLDGEEVAVVTGQEAALARARKIAGEGA